LRLQIGFLQGFSTYMNYSITTETKHKKLSDGLTKFNIQADKWKRNQSLVYWNK